MSNLEPNQHAQQVKNKIDEATKLAKNVRARSAFLNAKGFGGNNASALILSPEESMALVSKKYSKAKLKKYQSDNEGVKAKSSQHNKQCLKGKYNIIYKFNENVLQGEEDVKLEKNKLTLKGFKQSINLKK